MKKIIGLVLSISMLFTFIPCAVYAENAGLVIDSFDVNISEGVVSVNGSVTIGQGNRTVTLSVMEKNTDWEDVEAFSQSLQNIAMVKTDIFGKFEYSFDIAYKSEQDIESYKMMVTLANNGESEEFYFDCLSRESYEFIKSNSILMSDNCKNVFAYGEDAISENAPYKSGENVYVDAEFIAGKLGIDLAEYNFTYINGTNYVDINEFKNFGKQIYVGENVFVISDNEINGDVDVLSDSFGIYVLPVGSDENTGTAASPVKTLTEAVVRTDENDCYEEDRIYLMGGEHSVFNAVEINEKNNLTIENYANEAAALKGSIKLAKEDFEGAEDAEVLSKVDEQIKSKLVQIDLSKYVEDVKTARELGTDKYYRLYESGSAAMLARYPNAEYVRSVKAGETVSEGYKIDDRVSTWSLTDAWIGGMINAKYFFNRAFISKYGDDAFTTDNFSKDIANINIIAYNIPEELDVPGEWYIDAENKMLYLYPSGELDNIELTVSESCIFDIKNSENITIRGFELGSNNDTAINIDSSENITLDNLKIRAVGGYGAYIAASSKAVVKNSEIFDIGKGGVYINDKCGNVAGHIAGECGVENCHIYNYSDENTNMPGVYLNGIGNFARHNVMHDSMSQGILIVDYDNIAENNEIYNVVRDIFDAGAIYSGGFGFAGLQINNNYIHHIQKSYSGWGNVYGLYADNAASGITIRNNVVTQRGLFGGGRNNIIDSNIFIDATNSYDTRALIGEWYRGEKNLSPEVLRYNYDKEAWYTAHPEMEEMINDSLAEKAYLASKTEDEDGNVTYTEEKVDAGIPKNVVVTNNLVINDKKATNLNPISLWWSPDKEGYNTTYEGNLGIMKSTYQKSEYSDKYSHDEGGSMRYEIINDDYTTIKSAVGDNITNGELYRVSAWIYAETINDTASVNITVDNNPAAKKYPYTLEDEKEVPLTAGEWHEVYCYWAANDNDNSVVISFPQISVGDVVYIDDVTFEKINIADYGDLQSLMAEGEEGEYKYYPYSLDLSETQQTIPVGESVEVKAYYLADTSSDTDGDGLVKNEEIIITPQKADGLTYSSDNTAIATVDSDGKITAIGSGMAVITAADTNGNTSSVTVSCYDSDMSADYWNDAKGYVKDNDPIHNNEVLRGYYSQGNDMGYTAEDGMMINCWFYDNGVHSDLNTSSMDYVWTFGSDKYSVLIRDVYYTDGTMNVVPAGGARKKRALGWHQLSCVFTEKDDDNLYAQWYYNGAAGLKKTVAKGAVIKFGVSFNSGKNPVYIKDLFVVSKNARTTDLSERNIKFESFNETIDAWTTDRISAFDKIYDGNTGMFVDNYEAWFEDYDAANYNLKEDAELFSLIPDFNPFDFNAIGNTTLIGEELKAPVLRSPINGSLSENSFSLYWSEVPGASMYTLKISKNSDMTEIVYEQDLKTNMADVTLLEGGKYYWTVTALNLSKQYKSEAVSGIEAFSIENGILFDSVTVSAVDENTNEAVFTYKTSYSSIAGNAILAQKDTEGRLISAEVIDIPSVSDSKITIRGTYDNENILECYLWKDLSALVPYLKKYSSK